MMKMFGLALLAMSAVACGTQNEVEETESSAVLGEYTFSETARSELSQEALALPQAMVLRVPLLADGTESAEGAELRAASHLSSNVVADWESGTASDIPESSRNYLVVNPPGQKQQGQKNQTRLVPKKGQGKMGILKPLADVYARGGIAVGPRGVVVGGSVGYVNGRGYSHYPYYYNRHGRHHGNYNSYRYGGYGAYSAGGYYYTNRYRPVYRSRYSYGGYGAYWGYYSRPTRYVHGGYGYYVYPRPRCWSYCGY